MSNAMTGTPVAPTVPDAPPVLSATPGDGQATVTFDYPPTDGGATVQSYQASVDGGTTWIDLTLVGEEPYVAVINGLTNGTTYSVQLRAVNSVGPGAASAGHDVTPVGPPLPLAPTVGPAT